MKLRWWINVEGLKLLQYFDQAGYWRNVDIELEVKQEYKIQGELRARIRELEADYQALIDARK